MTNSCRKIQRKIIRGMDEQRQCVEPDVRKHLGKCSECAAFYRDISAVGLAIKQELEEARAELKAPDFSGISETARIRGGRKKADPVSGRGDIRNHRPAAESTRIRDRARAPAAATGNQGLEPAGTGIGNKGPAARRRGKRGLGLLTRMRQQGPPGFPRYTRIAAGFILVIGLSILIALSVNNRRVKRQVEEEVSVLLETIFSSADYPGTAAFSSGTALDGGRGLFPGSETGFGDGGFVEEIHSSLRRNMSGDA